MSVIGDERVRVESAAVAKAQKDPSWDLADLLGSKPLQSLLRVSRLFRQKGYDVEPRG
jgi:hypothetical protein